MISNKELLSQTISYIRFPLIVLVVVAHFNIAYDGLPFRGIIYGQNCAEWYRNFVIFFSDVMPALCVPVFYVMSGFLFFYGKDFTLDTYVSKLRRRVWTLLVPYLLWNLITLLSQMIRMNAAFASIFPTMSKTEFHFSLARLFNTFFNNTGTNGLLVSPLGEFVTAAPAPINVPLWFIRDLMVFALLSPIVYWLIKKLGGWLLLVLFILSAFSPEIPILNGSYTRVIVYYMIFFSWGAYYSINRLDLIQQLSKFRYAGYFYIPFALLDLFTKEQGVNLYIHVFSIYLGIIMVFTLVSHLLSIGKIRVNNVLTSSSFFIYAFHSLIISDIAKVILMVFKLPNTTAVMLGLYLLVPTITILIGIGLYLLLKRYTPALCSLLSGGR